eukprot:m51a1_g6917 putative intron-binding protein aquarius (1361) ;mRNA; r:132672-138053
MTTGASPAECAPPPLSDSDDALALWEKLCVATATQRDILALVVFVNRRSRDSLPSFSCLRSREAEFVSFMERACVRLREASGTAAGPGAAAERLEHVLFLTNCYRALEEPLVRRQALRLVGIALWNALSEERVRAEVRAAPQLAGPWRAAQHRRAAPETRVMPALVEEFFGVLASLPENPPQDAPEVVYCTRFLELMSDLLSQLPTRRFFRAFFSDCGFVVRARLSPAVRTSPRGSVLARQVDQLRDLEAFEVDDQTGEALTADDAEQLRCARVQALQRAAHALFPEKLRELALSNIAAASDRTTLARHLAALTPDELRALAAELAVVGRSPRAHETREFITESLLSAHERRPSMEERLRSMPLYPNEEDLWGDSVLALPAPAAAAAAATRAMALPKLNLQFLTFGDYLHRNHELYRLEAAHAVREDVEDAARRLKPAPRKSDGATELRGFARMALPLVEFHVRKVGKARLGETRPSEVLGEARVSLADCKQPRWREEWESLRQHDVLFLVQVRPGSGASADPVVSCVRGCEVYDVADERGRSLLREGPGAAPQGSARVLRVRLDPAQYHADTQPEGPGADLYARFNAVVRRKSEENNFKAVLETVRSMFSADCSSVVPEWLRETILGYGDMEAAATVGRVDQIDFVDTFVDETHLRACLPGVEVADAAPGALEALGDGEKPLYRVKFSEDGSSAVATPYVNANCGPYPQDRPRRNQVPFTPAQVAAIRSGMNEGLTLVVGPPGTGKTDVAVQIVSNLYHTFPGQRTLLVTHSNNALNQIFDKIVALDIDERHCLRLGHGEKELETIKDFSRQGRVNYMLELRLRNLMEVDKLSKAIGVFQDMAANTCETAQYFYLLHVLSRWERFVAAARTATEPDFVVKNFPFTAFFADAPVQPLFSGNMAKDMEVANGCFAHIQKIFTELQEARAFELLRNMHERGNYLLTKQARVVAMTCTHAAIRRSDLLALDFRYDNIVVEESAQILEIEAFVPLLLQSADREGERPSRLKRVILIGDHNQLPPIVASQALAAFSHLDQSLFARLVRLGVPSHTLDAQGRARPELAALWSWRYPGIADLPFVSRTPEFLRANAGLALEHQIIDVADYNGSGETAPMPFFYQNLGEAEYLVQTYIYMRLLGYPRESITMLTTYNGQKALLRDVVNARCAGNPLIGAPRDITTVDKFQGRQRDYVLLSLVRTRHAGHLRDARRLVVALSRARLGLYVFCRRALFERCRDVAPAFARLGAAGDGRLMLVPGEQWPTQRAASNGALPQGARAVSGLVEMGQVVGALLEERTRERAERQQEEVLRQLRADAAAAEEAQRAQQDKAAQDIVMDAPKPAAAAAAGAAAAQDAEEDEEVVVD